MTAAATTSGLIEVGNTKLYHEVRGSGPALLFISSGGGDAGQWMHVAPTLAQEFTVVTYDRRGFSRSPRPDGWAATSVTEHADDAAALLRALDLAPAMVVGHSSGASVACALVVGHPKVVRHAVIYEPPLLAAVPEGQTFAADVRTRIEQAMAEGGPRQAMEAFIRGNAGDEVADKWFESLDPNDRDRILDNGAVFFPIELPAFAAFVPDPEGMQASGVPLTVVAGEQNRDTWMGVAAARLAEGTGAELVELPGGHGGFVSHPKEFIELVRRIVR
jgi:pimeloyl-ACP methyl ester carboxylesterase